MTLDQFHATLSTYFGDGTTPHTPGEVDKLFTTNGWTYTGYIAAVQAQVAVCTTAQQAEYLRVFNLWRSTYD